MRGPHIEFTHFERPTSFVVLSVDNEISSEEIFALAEPLRDLTDLCTYTTHYTTKGWRRHGFEPWRPGSFERAWMLLTDQIISAAPMRREIRGLLWRERGRSIENVARAWLDSQDSRHPPKF